MTNEDSIRDHLSINLGVIEDNLVLIEKEFKLKNHVGSKGFVDILAKDLYGNFVIIEIKRTKASSRETIQEILKYIGLIKQNFNARDSEIRVIVISVDWSELLVPFSELIDRTTLTVKGYQLMFDIHGFPSNCIEVQPLITNSFERRFTSSYSTYLFSNTEKRKNAIVEIESWTAQIGITNFVLIELDGDKKKDIRLMYCFGLVVALHELQVSECLAILEKSDIYVDEEIDFENEEHKIDYFNECLYVEIHEGVTSHDTLENGTPSSISQAISSETWKLQNIHKYGFYALDPRYNEDILIREIIGLDGKSDQAYLNFCESTHRDRFDEIKNNWQRSLKGYTKWKRHIKSVFNFLDAEKEPFRIVVSIYTSPAILLSLAKTLETNENYLPKYTIVIDYLKTNKTLVFEGGIVWNGKSVDEDDFIEFMMDENGFNFISKSISIIMGKFELKVYSKLQLKLQNFIVELEDGQAKKAGQVSFVKEKMRITDPGENELICWFQSYHNLLYRAIQIINSNSQGLF